MIVVGFSCGLAQAGRQGRAGQGRHWTNFKDGKLEGSDVTLVGFRCKAAVYFDLPYPTLESQSHWDTHLHLHLCLRSTFTYSYPITHKLSLSVA